MTLHLLDHAMFVLIAMVFPIVDFFSWRKHVALIKAGHTGLRPKLYRKIVRETWAITIVILALWFVSGRGAQNLGLIPGTGWLAWAGYAVTVLICVLVLAQARTLLGNTEGHAALREQIGELSFFTPQSREELRAFDLVSVSAGICEEVIYRGFAIAYLMAALGIPFWVGALLSSVIFGLNHGYQGPKGILRVAATGLALAALYWTTGSLWAPMVTHTLIDLTSSRIALALSETNPENPTLQGAA